MLSIRLPKELEAKLDHLASETKRTKSFYVREALVHYLADIEDSTIALQRLRDPTAKYYTTEELEDKLGL
jgi:RHH-type rel operon transcriptional repressor/antitoxin RelB